MTSGRFHPIEISSIIVNRERRQRRELTGIPDLAESIRRRGLIHPVVVDNGGVLIAGERRLEACRSLGWTHIPAQYADDLSPTEARAIELEENIKRLDIPWQDNCLAVKEYHELHLSEDPTWTYDRTGEAIGLSKQSISDQLKIANELISGNQQIIEAPKYSTARGIVERRDERRRAAELEEIDIIQRPEIKRSEAILTADFNEWAPTYSGPRFNLLHCDFPYGIGADKFVQGSAPLHGGYDDSAETYWALLVSLADNLERICAESCHLVFWFSFHHYRSTLDFFANRTNFLIDPFPLIWYKSDGVGIIPDPERGPRRIYETALFGIRGDRKVVRAKANAYSAPTVRDQHMSIKPEPVLRHFFEMLVDENTVMLDPTCGSGSAVRAAEALGAKAVTGLEKNPEFADRARLELNKARRLREAVA